MLAAPRGPSVAYLQLSLDELFFVRDEQTYQLSHILRETHLSTPPNLDQL